MSENTGLVNKDMYPDATMLELRAAPRLSLLLVFSRSETFSEALKMEKPWATDLRKASLRHQQAGRAMRLSR